MGAEICHLLLTTCTIKRLINYTARPVVTTIARSDQNNSRVACNVCCEGADNDNVTESRPRCECTNECEVVSFSTSISSSRLSPSVILDNIPDSSHIPEHFVNAMETRHRVDTSLMMQTVSLLTTVSEIHQRLRIQINTDIVDGGTSWTKALSTLLTSLGNMTHGHIADSIFILNILNDVYSKHINYIVTGLANQLQDCDILAAEVLVIINRVKSSSVSAVDVSRLQMLLNAFEYLNTTLLHFNRMLEDEAPKSSHSLHYFPIQLMVDNCTQLFGDVQKLVSWQLEWIQSFTSNTTANNTIEDIIFVNITNFRINAPKLSLCLLSYRKELDSFEDQVSTLTLTADFNYQPPTKFLCDLDTDGKWLDSITSQYLANSLSKLNLSEALNANGNKVLSTVDDLYSDMDLSLFSKVKDLINDQETNIVLFYNDLLKRATSLQRYMFANDTSLERFMRRLSIWRIPILNFQKSQVLSIFHDTLTLFVFYDNN